MVAGDTSTLITLKKFVTECNYNKRNQSIFIASVEENFTGGIILFSGGEQRGDQILQTQYKEFRGRTIISFFCKLTYLIICFLWLHLRVSPGSTTTCMHETKPLSVKALCTFIVNIGAQTIQNNT